MARKNDDRKVRELDKDFSKTNVEGCIRETLAVAKLLKDGYSVAKPFVTGRYDLIAEKNRNFMRIQVKNLKLEYRKDSGQPLSIDQYVVRAFTSPKGEKSTYSKDDIDFVFAINIEDENYAVIPIEIIPLSGIIKISEQCDRKQYYNSLKAIEDFVSIE